MSSGLAVQLRLAMNLTAFQPLSAEVTGVHSTVLHSSDPPVSDVISSASSKLISYLLSVFSVLLPNLRSSFGEFSKHCVK